MKKQISYIGIAKSACALLLCLAMLVCMVPPIQVSAADTDATAVFVGEDTETKGAWEGKYGKDTAYLVGYNFDATTVNPDPNSNAGRFAFAKTYDKLIQASNSKISSITNDGTARPWAWKAPADDEVVLDMPSGSDLTPFYAYAKDANATKFTVATTEETAVHAFTVYGTMYPAGLSTTFTPQYDFELTITDENGAVLLTQTLPKNTFDGGKYLTYLVTGSFTFNLTVPNSTRGGYGVNAVFIDAPQATNATFATLLAGGGSVSLAEDIVSNDPVVLPEGAVLDLNGYKLTTPSVMGAAGSVIDTSSNVSGRIDCAQGSLVLGEDNGYLPIWDGEAYLLAQPRMTDAYFNFAGDTNGFVITTRPGFGRSNGTNVATYLASADSGVAMNFVLSWKDVYGNEGNKPFVLDKDLVQEVYQSVGTENYAFQGTFRNPGDAQWYRVDVKLESCGVVVDSSNIATDAKIKYDNPNDNNRTYLFAHDFNAADLAWENNALTGKRGDSISSQSASGSYDYPTFDGTSMILNGGGNVNIVKLPVADIDVGTKIVIEANVALEGGSANINWFETTSSTAAYSKITATPVLISYNNANSEAYRTSISNKFIIRSEIEKEADGKYTITTSILGTDIQHTVTGTSFPTALIRRNRNAATMTLDYLIIYTETTTG